MNFHLWSVKDFSHQSVFYSRRTDFHILDCTKVYGTRRNQKCRTCFFLIPYSHLLWKKKKFKLKFSAAVSPGIHVPTLWSKSAQMKAHFLLSTQTAALCSKHCTQFSTHRRIEVNILLSSSRDFRLFLPLSFCFDRIERVLQEVEQERKKCSLNVCDWQFVFLWLCEEFGPMHVSKWKNLEDESPV